MMKLAALAVVALLAAGSAFAGSVPLFGGPAQTNPINNPADQADINAMINAMNGSIGPGMTTGTLTGVGIFTSGSLGGTFQSQGLLQTTARSLTTGLLNPAGVGGAATMKFFLTFVDSQGIQSFIPVWQ